MTCYAPNPLPLIATRWQISPINSLTTPDPFSANVTLILTPVDYILLFPRYY